MGIWLTPLYIQLRTQRRDDSLLGSHDDFPALKQHTGPRNAIEHRLGEILIASGTESAEVAGIGPALIEEIYH